MIRTAFVLATVLASHASATTIEGKARIVDGDTLAIGTQLIRLHGIDAPENGQRCKRGSKSYNCGAEAENALKALIKGSVQCSGDIFDDYQRLIAICTSNDIQLNKHMVLDGQALAFRKFSNDYINDEDSAKARRVGLWAGKFAPPWEFRAKKWASASEFAPDAECPIKGNINSKGDRIYHAPWSRSYSQTKINTSRGERWFCSEGEAMEAGWRAPYR